MNRFFVFASCFLAFTACFEKTSQKKIKAENLILNQCEYVITITEKYIAEEIPSSSFVISCGCISEILSQKMAEDFSTKEMEEIEKIPFELTKKIERYVDQEKETIKKTCTEKSKS